MQDPHARNRATTNPCGCELPLLCRMQSLVREIPAWSRRVDRRLDNVAFRIDLDTDPHSDMPMNGASYLSGHVGQGLENYLALDDRALECLDCRSWRLRLGGWRRERGRLWQSRRRWRGVARTRSQYCQRHTHCQQRANNGHHASFGKRLSSALANRFGSLSRLKIRFHAAKGTTARRVYPQTLPRNAEEGLEDGCRYFRFPTLPSVPNRWLLGQNLTTTTPSDHTSTYVTTKYRA